MKVETRPYTSGAFAADGRSLVLLARDENALFIYRATP
jgi:hypothetical protein